MFFEEPVKAVTSKQLQPVYKFGPFQLNPAERLLLRDGQIVPLPPKIFDTLLVLVEHSGHLVGKEELISRLWPDSFVEEATLARNISDLRKALGENNGEQRYIETIPRHGYRFVTAVKLAAEQETAMVVETETRARIVTQHEAESNLRAAVAQTRPAGQPRRMALLIGGTLLLGLAVTLVYFSMSERKATRSIAGVRSIAVLPFQPMGGQESDESLELGMADALITKLTNIKQVVVRPTNSVLKYNKTGQDVIAVGRELGVDSLLDGYIQRTGDRVRVTVQLISVKDSTPIWADKFDAQFTDLFTVQDAISEQIARALALNLTGEERKRLTKHYTENVEAYNLYLKGRYHERQFTEERVKIGIGYFRKAIEKDPDYALAYSGLADSYVALGSYYFLSPKEAFAEAGQAAMRAVQLDESLAEAYVSLATVRLCNWDWLDYEKNAWRARELNPNYAKIYYIHSQYLAAMGRFEEASAEAKRAQEFESPLDLSTNEGWILYFARRYDEAIEQYLKAVDLDRDIFRPHRLLGLAYLRKNQPEKAIAAIQQSVTLSGGSLEEKAYLGYAHAVAGKRGEALKIMRELSEQAQRRYVSPYLMALVAVGLGDKDQALAWLDQAYAAGSINLIYLNVEPIFDSLRSNPRWKELIRSMNYPEEQHGR